MCGDRPRRRRAHAGARCRDGAPPPDQPARGRALSGHHPVDAPALGPPAGAPVLRGAATAPTPTSRSRCPSPATRSRCCGRAMSPPHFPIGPDGLRGHWCFDSIAPGRHQIEGFEVLALEVAHKGGRTYGYRISDGYSSVAYLPDHATGPPDRSRAPGRRGRSADPRRPVRRGRAGRRHGLRPRDRRTTPWRWPRRRAWVGWPSSTTVPIEPTTRSSPSAPPPLRPRAVPTSSPPPNPMSSTCHPVPCHRQHLVDDSEPST